jgi:hypothetical protein
LNTAGSFDFDRRAAENRCFPPLESTLGTTAFDRD